MHAFLVVWSQQRHRPRNRCSVKLLEDFPPNPQDPTQLLDHVDADARLRRCGAGPPPDGEKASRPIEKPPWRCPPPPKGTKWIVRVLCATLCCCCSGGCEKACPRQKGVGLLVFWSREKACHLQKGVGLLRPAPKKLERGFSGADRAIDPRVGTAEFASRN